MGSGSIGDFVYEDVNEDGDFDVLDGDIGIDGAVVNLYGMGTQPLNLINLSGAPVGHYSGVSQDKDPDAYEILEGGAMACLFGNTWKSFQISPHTLTPDTVLEFEYKSDGVEPEISAITLDSNTIPQFTQYWKVYGTQNVGILIYDNYTPSDWKLYQIPVGQTLQGTMNYVALINDHDLGSGLEFLFP